MKVVLQFNLPEDKTEYEVVMQANKVQSFLWAFSQQLRSWYKYHNDFTDGNDALDKIKNKFYELLNEYNVDIDL